MPVAQRTRTLVQFLLVIGVVCFASDARAQRARCQIDALEKWYCAEDPLGSAVVDKLGRVVCAPGACVKHEGEDEHDWICSSEPGGKAVTSPEGPICDGGCRSPEMTECKRV